MKRPPFRLLVIVALLGGSTAVQAAAEPYLYGPVRKGEQLARIAWDLRPDKTRVGTWQMNAALYRANPRAFANGDMERLLPGKMLVVPTDEEVRRIDPELARRVAREPKNARTLLSGPLAAAAPMTMTEPATAMPAPAPAPATAPASAKAVLDVETGELRPAAGPARTVLHAETGELREVSTAAPARAPAPAALPLAPERRRPDAEARAPEPEPEQLPDPNRLTRLAPVAAPEPWKEYEKAPVPDRWRILNSLGLVPQHWWDPYNQNTLKADKPVVGDEGFFNVSLISDTTYEPRRLPTPVGPQSTGNSGSIGIFGGEDQWLLSESLILALVYLKGDTTFRPPNYELHLTPVLNFNRTVTEEDRAVNIDPRRGAVRNDNFLGIQELFVDYHLRNVSDRFDFDSVRFGIQPFSSDFRGFLFQDNQLAARLFGNRDNNRWQYNLAWIRRLEKDTNSGLNAINRELREDDIFVANLYRQDFPVPGFTSQGIVAYNRNREDDERFYDRNGFLARPFSFGDEKPIRYDVTYLGYNGDGHFGRLNLTLSGYLAAGHQNRSPFASKGQDILAGFAAAEASFDQDWIRWRLSGLYATGDHDPYDGQANGFDAIFENPVFAGADTNFWTRQAVPLIGGGIIAISQRNGQLNSLRHSKEHGQSNFINPGTILLGVGADFDLTPTFRLSTNFNHLWFEDSTVLEVARNQGDIGTAIGWDLSTAAIWRPFMTQNIVLRLSGSILLPGQGYQDLFPDDDYPYSILGNFIFTY